MIETPPPRTRKTRLHAIMARLRDGRLHTAEALAQDLGVSVRTIYRDMDALAASGVPVEGARGHGFSVQAAVSLPPLNLTEPEFEALRLALSALAASGMAEEAQAALSLAAKIEAVLPAEGAPVPPGFAPGADVFADAARGFAHMPAIRAAIGARQRLRIAIGDTAQVVRPLHLEYWGRHWHCVAWSETEAGFTTFRLDQLDRVSVLPGLFVDEPGKTLADWRARQT